MSDRQLKRDPASKPAFTLVELLIVIFIIAVLVGILIPVVSRVRQSARSAATQQTIATISNAIERFNQDFHRYPGPITNAQTHKVTTSQLAFDSADANYDNSWDPTKITGTENLVLELLGGLKYDSSTGKTYYDPTLVGAGALKPNDTVQGRRLSAYLNPPENMLSWRLEGGKKTGHFKDDAGEADDTIIPEFVDNYNSPMPILYIRANVGAPASATIPPVAYNSDNNEPIAQYDLAQIIGYTNTAIGVGRSPKSAYVGNTGTHGLNKCNSSKSLDPTNANYYYPYDLYPYLTNPAIVNTPRNKDGYILISAGPDRIYGTDDDICNFGSVK